LGSGYWVDNWWLFGRFIRVGDAASFSSSYWVDTCWWIGVGCSVGYLVGYCLLATIQQSVTILLVYLNEWFMVYING
jgi:hypothetical protein